MDNLNTYVHAMSELDDGYSGSASCALNIKVL